MKRHFILRLLLYITVPILTLLLATKVHDVYLYFGTPIPEELQPLFTIYRNNRTAAEILEAQDLPLKTKGRDVITCKGERFKIASVNWYGGSDELFIPSGLDFRHRSDIAKTIKRLGFNSVRLPYSDEMVTLNPLISRDLLLKNEDLVGGRALDIFEAVVEAMTNEGIAVIPNNHITQATWCCGINPCDAAWYNDYLGLVCRMKQSEEQWIQNWETVMGLFIDNPFVIGADLRNEVRGLWGTMPWKSWATAAEKAGNRLLALNPDWLIFVEGTSSSNDLTGVKDCPVVLDIENRIVYSSHVYGWSGWGTLAGPYTRRPYPSFSSAMDENWGYLLRESIAPVWVSEFGAPNTPNGGDQHYWDNLIRYLHEIDADFAYWALNPRKPHNNEKESYGLVEDDWETLVEDYRLDDMRILMAG
ncbi:glycoside hydrolase superfamily [Tricladium varicosporioides]|nr:glycoside hydrolase superfamily [Hymenoscyphus varicosporioides]